MKVKQTVAGLCLAAVVATSVGASAWVPWESSSPKSSVGAWEKYATQQYIVSKFTPNSKNGIAGAYVNDVNVYQYVMVHTEVGHVA